MADSGSRLGPFLCTGWLIHKCTFVLNTVPAFTWRYLLGPLMSALSALSARLQPNTLRHMVHTFCNLLYYVCTPTQTPGKHTPRYYYCPSVRRLDGLIPSPFPLPSLLPINITNKRIAQQTNNQLSHISALPQLQKSLYLTLSSGKFVRDSLCQQKTRFQSPRTNPVIASCNRSPRFFGKPSESTHENFITERSQRATGDILVARI